MKFKEETTDPGREPDLASPLLPRVLGTHPHTTWSGPALFCALGCCLLVGRDISTWRCLADCSGDIFIFLFKENFHGSLCHQGPLGAPGNMILSEEQRGKFAEDQMQRHCERRGLGVADENTAGSSPDLCVLQRSEGHE